MELTGTIKARGSLKGSFDFDQANYELLSNKPSINGVELVGNKTTEDLHIQTGGGGGSGGTYNYNDLENKPKINDVILQDELSLNSLGIQPQINYSGDSKEYLNGEGMFTIPSGKYNLDYEEQEVNTGRKWINGKDIYTRVIKLNNLTGNYNSINIDECEECISIGGTIQLGQYGQYILVNSPYIENGNYIASISLSNNGTQRKVEIRSNWGMINATIIIEETKI